VNASTYVEWLRRQGERVVQTTSSYWQAVGFGVYQAFPYHWLIEPTEQELSQLFFSHHAVAVRYSMPADASNGVLSYHTVCEARGYGFDNLGYRTRKNVRRGLRSCTVEPISFSRLTEEGWGLHEDTLDRQGRDVPVSKEAWRKRFLLAGNLPGFEAWGATVEGRLAAYLVTCQMDECCYLLYQQSGRDHLRECVNNALTFVVTQAIANRSCVRLLFYGMHSLDAPPSMDEFKFHMGYKARGVRQRVAFHPCLSPFVNRASYRVLKQVSEWRPLSRPLSKAEGIIRFYLEGQAARAKGAQPAS
jgi:hypothetical protein